MNRLERIIRLTPSFYHPASNTMINSLLTAISAQDELQSTEIDNAKDMLYITRAVKQFLDYLGANLSVARPTAIYFSDTKFRQLIPVLSFWPKQVKNSIYKCLELFWNTEYLHSTATSGAWEPFNLVGGETLSFTVDETKSVSVTFLASDFATPGAATAQEVVDRINEWLPDYLIAYVHHNKLLNRKYVKISTNTYGLAGSVQVTGGTANVALAFSTDKQQYTKVSLHELNPTELVVRMPKKILLDMDTLLWSHRFHADSTIIDGRPTVSAANPYWPGSFFYDFSTGSSIWVTNTKTTLAQSIAMGGHYAAITVTDSSQFPNASGYITFNFGLTTEEKSVKYLSRPNNSTILLDATYAFTKNHSPGEEIMLTRTTPYVPRITGIDYPIFFVDPEIAYSLISPFILLLKAAGVICRFIMTDE